MPFAHSLPNTDVSLWQTLQDHSEAVASLAASFAEPFSSADAARLLGFLHDLGKSRASFQNYLFHANGILDSDYDAAEHSHSGAGACWAAVNVPGWGKLLAYALAGHHAGLPDWLNGSTPDGALMKRLDDERAILSEPEVLQWIEEQGGTWSGKSIAQPWRPFEKRDASLWIRMLFSCLVDADFLDTESFMESRKSRLRGGWRTIGDVAETFFRNMEQKRQSADSTPVNVVREEIREACEKAAKLAPGLFTLTVPTGGGKTLSSTAFALRHALRHGMRRIIYVIPYTSIIEQTADTLRGMLGENAVLEHHSNLAPERDTPRSQLAAENWDAPVVVTTSVQFFESLFASKSSRCRKLHNIAGSVVVLDEVQLLPGSLILPIAESIHQLCAHYGVSLVLSTATQTTLPELKPLQGVPAREMMPASLNLDERLRRTHIEFPERNAPRKTWEEVAVELQRHSRVLCIVNTRRDCRELFEKMPEGTLHLSASMCGEHRSKLIAEIKEKLKSKGTEPVRVISTQLVEAGVDIDFPVVYRAYTGLASIAQSAGRCNREGRMGELGKVVVFMPPRPAPLGELRWAEDSLTEMRVAFPLRDLDKSDVYPDFFRRFYSRHHEQGENIQGLLSDVTRIQFREAADAFQMMDGTEFAPVLVRYGKSDALIEKLRVIGPCRDTLRPLQRYIVNVPRGIFNAMLESGAVSEVGYDTGIYAQTMPSLYSEKLGLDMTDANPSPDDFIS